MFELDLFLHPLNEVKSELDILNHKVKIAECFEHAKQRLQQPSLDNNSLSKCRLFVDYLNQQEAGSKIIREVCELALHELQFVSICFAKTQLDLFGTYFKFSDLRAYMEKRSITCRDDVLAQRLRNRANDSPGTNFHTLYNKALSAEHTPKVMQTDLTTDSTHSAETGFKLSGASWENIRQIFGPEVIKGLNVAGPSPQMTTSVSGWFPRAGGDGYIWLDVESDNLALSLLDITGKIRMERVRSMFGERVHGLIEKSDLRQRENQELAETNCVKMTHCIEIRIGAGDLSVINKLFE